MVDARIILWIPLLPLIGFAINGLIAIQKARGRGFLSPAISSLVAVSMPLGAFLLALLALRDLHANPHHVAIATGPLWEWMATDGISISIGLSVDTLASVMVLIVTGVGSLIHIYSTGYMKGDAGYARYLSYLNLFLFFMLVLVMGDSLPLLFVGWEGVGLCSYLLIGFWFADEDKARAGKKAFVVNRIGDFAFLVAMFALVAAFTPMLDAGEIDNPAFLSFAFLHDHVGVLTPALATLVTLCLFAAVTGKSAQLPLYVWLPDAMAGPTPVSALIHAATMVTAGIYLVARLSFLFLLVPFTLNVIILVGLATALMAALIAVTQYDIKKVLAYSTVSQLGFMVMGLGVGGFSAAIFHVMTHAFFKACLFLGAGSVIHGLHHEQDIRKMGGLWGRMPITAITFFIATLAIAGIPPFSGFFSKDEILYLIYARAPWPIYMLALLTAGITTFYMMRLFVYVFLSRTRYPHPEKIHESPVVMTVPLIVLALLSVMGGALGIPHVIGHGLGLGNVLESWLQGLGQVVPEHVDGTLKEGHLMAISAAWVTLCSGAAFVLYRRDLNFAAGFRRRFSGLYRLVANKFYLDEIYDWVLVKPVKGISDFLLYHTLDVKLIDGLLVHGWVDAAGLLGRVFSSLQTGLVNHYLFYLLFATLGLLGLVMWG